MLSPPHILSLICFDITDVTLSNPSPHILSLICFDTTDIALSNPLYTIVDMLWHHWRHVIKPPIYYRWYVLTSLTSRYQTPHILSLICFDITDVTLSNPLYTIIDMLWHYWRHVIKPLTPYTIADMFWHHWRHVTKPPLYYRWYALTSLTSRYQTQHILSLICFDITDVTLSNPLYTIVDMLWHHWRHVTNLPIYYRWYVLTSLTSRYQTPIYYRWYALTLLTSRYQTPYTIVDMLWHHWRHVITPHILSLICFDNTDVTLSNPSPHILSLICFDTTDIALSNPLYTIVDMLWHHWRHVTKPPIYYRWYVLTSLTSRYQTPHILSLICFDITDVTLSNPLYTIIDMLWHYWRHVIKPLTPYTIVDMFWHHWRHVTKPPLYYRWYALTSLTSRYQIPYILSLICFDITDVTLPTSPYTIVDMFWHHWRHVTKHPYIIVDMLWHYWRHVIKPPYTIVDMLWHHWRHVITPHILSLICFDITDVTLSNPSPHILSLICFDTTDIALSNPLYTIVDMLWHHWRHVTKPPIYYRWYVLTSLTSRYQTPHILSLICFDITDVTLSNPLYTIVDMLWHYWRHVIKPLTPYTIVDIFWHHWHRVIKPLIHYRWYALTSLTSRYQPPHILSLICFDITDVTLPNPIYYRWYALTLLTSHYQTPIYYRWYALTSLTLCYHPPYTIVDMLWHYWRHVINPPPPSPHILSLICLDMTDVTLPNPPYTIADMFWHHWRHATKPPIYYRWYALTSLTSRYQTQHLLSLICFARNRFLIASHISGFKNPFS